MNADINVAQGIGMIFSILVVPVSMIHAGMLADDFWDEDIKNNRFYSFFVSIVKNERPFVRWLFYWFLTPVWLLYWTVVGLKCLLIVLVCLCKAFVRLFVVCVKCVGRLKLNIAFKEELDVDQTLREAEELVKSKTK